MPNSFSHFSPIKKPSPKTSRSQSLSPSPPLPTRRTKAMPFKDYYADWFKTIKNKLLPLLNQSLSTTNTTMTATITTSTSTTLLSSHLHLLLHHFLSYYDALDLLATSDPTSNLPYLLFPPWRHPIEIPFLFLGDLHPYTFTNLLRSFLDDEGEDDESDAIFDTKHRGFVTDGEGGVSCLNWQVVMAWKDPPDRLLAKIEQIERGLRLMVPALVDRVKKAQAAFVNRVGEQWFRSTTDSDINGEHNAKKSKEKTKKEFDVGEAVKAEMDEMVCVFIDANRLRRNVITEIVGALSVYQGALFLQALAQFLVGFKDPCLLRDFDRCKDPINE